MADFAGLLKKTIDKLTEPTPQMRERVYLRARETVIKKLRDVNVPKKVADAQLQILEQAIVDVEADYVAKEKALLGIEPSTVVDNKDENHPADHYSNSDEEDAAKATLNATTEEFSETPSTTKKAKSKKTAYTVVEKPLIIGQSVDVISDNENLQNAMAGNPDIARAKIDERATENETISGAKGVYDGDGAPDNRKPAVERFVAGEQTTSAEEEIVGDTSARLKPDDDASVYASRRPPNAEPVNLRVDDDDGVDRDLEIADQEDGPPHHTSQNHTGNFDVVSDIFVQAARRGERAAAKRKRIIIAISSLVLIIFIAIVVAIGWKYLAAQSQNEPPASSDSAGQQDTTAVKLTQRLLEDGSEVDPGPAKAPATAGEGTSNASATTQGVEEAGEAVYYESRSDTEPENIDRGTVTWTLAHEAAADGQTDEFAIRGDVTIPHKGISVRLTIRRNQDKTLPAAYLVEVVYTIPDDFPGGAMDDLKELTFKASEQAIGQPLNGATKAKFGDNYFVLAINNMRPFIDGDLVLMKKLNWIQLVTQYKDGRVGELSLSKGKQGEDIFNKVLDAWLAEQNKPTIYDQTQQKPAAAQ